MMLICHFRPRGREAARPQNRKTENIERFIMIPTRNSSSVAERHTRDSQTGFTLIELLVVIAIIAILAAILFPVFSRARENARRSACQSNEKQLGLAIIQYIQDNDEYPPCGVTIGTGRNLQPWTLGEGWGGQVYPYLRNAQVFACPDDTVTASGVNNVVSYGYNNALVMGLTNQSNGNNLSSLAAMVSPSMTVLITEGSSPTSKTTFFIQGFEGSGGYQSPIMDGNYFCDGWWANNAGTYATDAGPLGSTAVVPSQSIGLDPGNPTGRHLDGSNFLFFDGHVKWLKGANVSPGQNAASATAAQTGGYAAGTSGTSTTGAPVAATYSIR